MTYGTSHDHNGASAFGCAAHGWQTVWLQRFIVRVCCHFVCIRIGIAHSGKRLQSGNVTRFEGCNPQPGWCFRSVTLTIFEGCNPEPGWRFHFVTLTRFEGYRPEPGLCSVTLTRFEGRNPEPGTLTFSLCNPHEIWGLQPLTRLTFSFCKPHEIWRLQLNQVDVFTL